MGLLADAQTPSAFMGMAFFVRPLKVFLISFSLFAGVEILMETEVDFFPFEVFSPKAYRGGNKCRIITARYPRGIEGEITLFLPRF